MATNNQGLIPRGDFQVGGHRIDPVGEGMNQVEEKILDRIVGPVPAVKVALRIVNEVFVVATRLENGHVIKLSFDQTHIPGVFRDEHYQLISRGIIDYYKELLLHGPPTDQPKAIT